MVTYELIEELQKVGLYQLALQKGVISTSVNYKKYVYEVYLSNKGRGKEQAVRDTMEDTEKSRSYIYQLISDMES